MMVVLYCDIVMTNPSFLSRVMMTTTVQQYFLLTARNYLCIILFGTALIIFSTTELTLEINYDNHVYTCFFTATTICLELFSRLISWQNKRVRKIAAKRGIINGKSQFVVLVSENK